MIPFSIDDILIWIKGKKEADIDEMDRAFLRTVLKRDKEAYQTCIELCTLQLDSNPDNLKALKYRAAAYFRTDRLDEAILDFHRVVELDPQDLDIYLERARYYQRREKYSEAIADYSRVIELCKGDRPEYHTFRAQCYAELNQWDDALKDYNCSIEIKPSAEAYFGRGQLYSASEPMKAIDNFTKAIEMNPDDEKAYRLRGELFEKQEQYGLAEYDYNKSIEIDPENGDAYVQRADLYHYKLSKFESAISDYYKAIRHSFTRSWTSNDLYEEIIEASKKLTQHQAELENQLKEEKIREEERKKIIADLSHSIKNLISTVIDPLENLKQEATVRPQVIENALRGANLIREIVNAVNLSFKGSIEDFRYDAVHNTDSDSQNVKAIITAALKHSVGNMFDGKYFGTFSRKYFPEKPLYLAAKTEWSSLSQSFDINDLLPFLEKYFFKTDFDLNHAEQFIIGNQKGSIIKLMILFQEMILNAVKYSAFIGRENRSLKIHFEASETFISILVENPFDRQIKVKTSGIGHVIIENFAQLLNTTPVVKNDEEIYSIQIRFQNIWKEADQ